MFDRTVIASPVFEHFQKVDFALRDLLKDPVMVGFIPHDTRSKVTFSHRDSQYHDFIREQNRYAPGAKINNGVGFLIALWGLTEDLKAGSHI